MRSMHIYCDGGFGNRFNGLVAGLLLARAAGLARAMSVLPKLRDRAERFAQRHRLDNSCFGVQTVRTSTSTFLNTALLWQAAAAAPAAPAAAATAATAATAAAAQPRSEVPA